MPRRSVSAVVRPRLAAVSHVVAAAVAAAVVSNVPVTVSSFHLVIRGRSNTGNNKNYNPMFFNAKSLCLKSAEDSGLRACRPSTISLLSCSVVYDYLFPIPLSCTGASGVVPDVAHVHTLNISLPKDTSPRMPPSTIRPSMHSHGMGLGQPLIS